MASTAALELIVSLDDKASKGMDDIAKKGGGMGKAFGGALKGAALLTGGIGVLGAGLFAAGQAAADEEVGMIRLQKTLANSVKGYDEATAGVEDYIGQQEKLAFADDELRDSLGHLVGQTGDLAEAQNLQATAMDLARAKGISLEMATKAVGKVDQESIGILKKLGIQVTENMTKEEALTAIREQSAGQAEAYAKSAAGSMELVQNAMGNAVEDIGGLVLPMLTSVISGVATFVGAISDAFKTGDFSQIGTMVINALGGILNWITSMIGPLMETLAGWAAAFINWIGPMIPGWIAAAAGFIGSVIQWLADQVPVILAKFGEWAAAFWGWIGPMIPQWLSAAGAFITSVIQWLGDSIPGIVAKLVEWATAFLGWIAPMIPPLLLKLGELLVALGGWIVGTALPELAKMLLQWVGAFLGWIGPILAQLPGKLADIAGAVWTWISGVAQDMPGKVAEWAVAFWNWITDVVQGISAKLADIASALWTWVTGIAGEMPGKIVEWATAFWSWITNVLSNIGAKLGEIVAAIWKWISQTATDIYTAALDIGKNLVKGFWDGFMSLLPAATEELGAGMNAMMGRMKEEAGTKSPSTITFDIGKNIMQGLMDGFGGMAETALNAIVAVMTAIVSAAKTTLGTSAGPSPLFATMGQLAMSGLQGGIDSNGKLATTAMETQVKKLLPTAKANLGDFKTVGAAISAGVNAGINNTWGGVVNNIMGKARALASQAKAALDIRSPSGVFMTIGEQMMEGWAAGIEKGAVKVRGALGRAVGGIMPIPNPAYAISGGGSPSSRIGLERGGGAGKHTIILDIDVNNPASGAEGFRIGRDIVRILEDAGLHDRLINP